jgi:site-specific DNA recombinase
MSKNSKIIRCAIYTRKSSDEGLDQAFNSLDAQRAAGEAYITSQASEGWTIIPTHYDDGGYSGGTMERPGLKALLADIEAGRIDVVVVYKIDRLTRSLTDFSRIIETFDKAGTSFVSVTQSFNTTDSMGRLMLNVLLSFAQFEREVTGERIRDKIAASKAKGMWMGGNLPLGYDLPAAGTRTLLVNEADAITVRQIFNRYLEIGSVHALQRELASQGINSKHRTFSTGRTSGGQPFSRGALFHLLRNQIYLGKIVHKDQVFKGAHDGIVEPDLFDRVQAQLDAQVRRHSSNAAQRSKKAPLTGKLFDAKGEPMSPAASRGKSGREYRYYVSASLQQGLRAAGTDLVQRLSATEIERIIAEAIQRWSLRADDPFSMVRSVHLSDRGLQVTLDTAHCANIVTRLADNELVLDRTPDRVTILLPVIFPARGGRHVVVPAQVRPPQVDRVLIAALRKAYAMLSTDRGLPTMDAAPTSPYDRNILRLAFLAPDIQQAILDGRQPHHLNLEALKSIDLPLSWPKQRDLLQFRQ